ncbi:MAG TPA: hypothetical protein VLC07_07965, partial [Solirubrobacterales bacterium]|nr:hypothetical protein [Solirubrobacterales bacterium]
GSGDGAFVLGVMLLERKAELGAEAAFQRADERGHAEGATHLGLMLQERGDMEGAIAAYQRGDARGDALGAYQYGINVEKVGGGPRDTVGALMRAEKRGYEAATPILDQMLAPMPGEHPISIKTRRDALGAASRYE